MRLLRPDFIGTRNNKMGCHCERSEAVSTVPFRDSPECKDIFILRGAHVNGRTGLRVLRHRMLRIYWRKSTLKIRGLATALLWHLRQFHGIYLLKAHGSG